MQRAAVEPAIAVALLWVSRGRRANGAERSIHEHRFQADSEVLSKRATSQSKRKRNAGIKTSDNCITVAASSKILPYKSRPPEAVSPLSVIPALDGDDGVDSKPGFPDSRTPRVMQFALAILARVPSLEASEKVRLRPTSAGSRTPDGTNARIVRFVQHPTSPRRIQGPRARRTLILELAWVYKD